MSSKKATARTCDEEIELWAEPIEWNRAGKAIDHGPPIGECKNCHVTFLCQPDGTVEAYDTAALTGAKAIADDVDRRVVEGQGLES